MKNTIFFLTFLILIAFAYCASTNSSSSTSTESVERTITPEDRKLFKAWRLKYKKKYNSPEEEKEAFLKFLENSDKIDEHNELYESGEVTFKRGLWKYSDMSPEEKAANLGGIILPPESRSLPEPAALPQFPVGPPSVDWGKKGLVGDVQDQGW